MEDPEPDVNPLLDRVGAAEAFQRTGRVHIPNILTETSAQRLHHALEQETPWGLIFNEGQKVHEFASISRDDHENFAINAYERAHASFQYFYHYYRLLENCTVYPKPDHYLGRVVALLTAPHFLALAREITGVSSIAWISATATLFKPLDFLKMHDDGHGKIVAYVLNMTPKWHPDWGGALQFYDNRHHIEEGFLPTFNALNLFRVPKLHSVSQVAVFGSLRYSISGWFEAAPEK